MGLVTDRVVVGGAETDEAADGYAVNITSLPSVDPTDALVREDVIIASLALKLSLTGGTMSGNIAMAGNNITSTASFSLITTGATSDLYLRPERNLFLGDLNTDAVNIGNATATDILLGLRGRVFIKSYQGDVGDLFKVLAPDDAVLLGVDSTTDLTTVGGGLYVPNGTVSIGTDDTIRGIVNLRGHATGSANGGLLRLYAATDHDTNTDYFYTVVSSAYMEFGTSDGGEIFRITESSGAVRFSGNKPLQFRDAAIHIASLTDGHLDLTADVSIDLNAPITALATTTAIQFRDVAIQIASLDDGHLDVTADVSIDLNAPITALATNTQIQFRDAAIYIASLTDGYLDYRADIAHRFGDGTNYMEIKADGEINLHVTARVYKYVWLSVAGLKAPGAKAATEVDYGIGRAWEFTDATDDTVTAAMKIPDDMDISVIPSFGVGWSTPTASVGNARWQVEYVYRAIDEAMDAAADATLVANFAASATAKGQVLSLQAASAAPGAGDICVKFRIKRRADEAGDTLGEDCHLHGLCMKYMVNKLGEAIV